MMGEKVKKMIVWSGGGLKSKENLDFFKELAVELQIVVEANFFAQYHGHNEVDGHYAAGKRMVKSNAHSTYSFSHTYALDFFLFFFY